MHLRRSHFHFEAWKVRAEIHSARGTWSERRGVILSAEDELGRTGLGEASPLPGYSPESLQDCHEALTSILSRGLHLDDAPDQGLREIANIAELEGLPAAKFAIEMVYLDLLGQRTATTPRDPVLEAGTSAREAEPSAREVGAVPPACGIWSPLLSHAAPQPARVAALLENDSVEACVASLLENDSVEACVASAHGAFSTGITTFKLKIGRSGYFELELEQLRALRSTFGTQVQIRADANRCLPEPLIQSLEQLRPFNLEFLEEPSAFLPTLCRTLQEMTAAGNPFGVPIALDESLQGMDPEQSAQPVQQAQGAGDGREPALATLADSGMLGALVLKPMSLGGIARCLGWARWADRRGVKKVVSHLFGGPIASRWERRLAASIASTEVAQGLHYQPSAS